MSVTSVTKDAATLTMTVVADFAAPPERVWRLWEDPRLLERWWGPPAYPATFVELDLSPGGRASYFMTGPGGDQPHGWWRVVTVEAPRRLEFESGFADDQGVAVAGAPTMVLRVTLTDTPDGTHMETVVAFASIEAMEKVMAMGMEEGMTGAMGQMDALLG
jgi:uncharacterized protein YndB with AHSA1/START domain